jgi:hypothetical protein
MKKQISSQGMARSLFFALLVGCTLQSDPSQNQSSAVVVNSYQAGEAPPPNALPPLDRLTLLVIGEFGVVAAEGNVETGEFVLNVPPGPSRQFQLIGERNLIPVLFGAINADVVAGQQEPIVIPTQSAAGMLTSTLDSALNLLPLEDLSLLVLDAAAGLPNSISLNQSIELAPLPIGTYQIDPSGIPAGLVLPEGEELIFLSSEGSLLEREIVLFNEQEPLNISITPEGLSLRIKIQDANNLTVPFIGNVTLEDKGGLLNLPPLLTFSAVDAGEKLLSNVLSVPGLFGVATISARADNAARSKGVLPFVLLDILPGGAPTRLILIPAQDTLQGNPRPEPGDLVVAAVDSLGRVSNTNATVTLSASAGAFLRQSTVTLSQGVAVAKRAVLPTGAPTTITITATSTGLTSANTTIVIQ